MNRTIREALKKIKNKKKIPQKREGVNPKVHIFLREALKKHH